MGTKQMMHFNRFTTIWTPIKFVHINNTVAKSFQQFNSINCHVYIWLFIFLWKFCVRTEEVITSFNFMPVFI